MKHHVLDHLFLADTKLARLFGDLLVDERSAHEAGADDVGAEWYNRAGVDRVMGFCTAEESERFLFVTPMVEREMVVQNGIILRKYFLDISQDEQRRRFEARIDAPVKHWKLSPMDVESVRRWWEYTAAYHRMIEATH